MRLRFPFRPFVAVALAGLAAVLSAGAARADESAADRLKRHLAFLAGPECEGRGPGTAGIDRAADYIAAEFKACGLKPAPGQKDYFQHFTMRGPARLRNPGSLVIDGPGGKKLTPEAAKEFQVVGLSGSGKASAELVFAGYGISSEADNYDDYKGVDAAGKVVIILRQTPRVGKKDGLRDAEQLAALTAKLTNADNHKAAGVIFVNDGDKAGATDDLMPFNYSNQGGAGKLPAVHVKRSTVDAILATAGTTLAKYEADVASDLKPRHVAVTGWSATVETTVDRTPLNVKNVIGILEGAGPSANETVVVGGHYDHLGYGGAGSLARSREPAIHYGADDNASGTTAVLELARRFAAKGTPPARRLVFMAFSGEETGLLGSRHYVEHPLYPLDQTAVMINLDMVGRLGAEKNQGKDKLSVYGTGTGTGLDAAFDKINEKYQFAVAKIPGGMGPSDHASFYSKKVPVYFLFTGIHQDYHRPSDTPEKINVAGMEKVINLAEDMTAAMVGRQERPAYVKVSGGGLEGSRVSVPRLGFQPGDYAEEDKGVLVGGVTDGGPAAKGGIKAGDYIVEVGGKPVKNMSGYMTALAGQRRGEPLKVVVTRDGKKVELSVTPQ